MRWGPRKGGSVMTQKEFDRMEGTHLWSPQRKGYVATSDLVRSSNTWKESGRARVHTIEDRRGRNTSAHGKKVNEQGTLTVERPQKEGHARARKKATE